MSESLRGVLNNRGGVILWGLELLRWWSAMMIERANEVDDINHQETIQFCECVCMKLLGGWISEHVESSGQLTQINVNTLLQKLLTEVSSPNDNFQKQVLFAKQIEVIMRLRLSIESSKSAKFVITGISTLSSSILCYISKSGQLSKPILDTFTELTKSDKLSNGKIIANEDSRRFLNSFMVY